MSPAVSRRDRTAAKGSGARRVIPDPVCTLPGTPMNLEGRRKTGGYRWRSRPAERKPGRSRLTGPCRKAWDPGFRGRPADFANGILVIPVDAAGPDIRHA